jgi:hypothetical protein
MDIQLARNQGEMHSDQCQIDIRSIRKRQGDENESNRTFRAFGVTGTIIDRQPL